MPPAPAGLQVLGQIAAVDGRAGLRGVGLLEQSPGGLRPPEGKSDGLGLLEGSLFEGGPRGLGSPEGNSDGLDRYEGSLLERNARGLKLPEGGSSPGMGLLGVGLVMLEGLDYTSFSLKERLETLHMWEALREGLSDTGSRSSTE